MTEIESFCVLTYWKFFTHMYNLLEQFIELVDANEPSEMIYGRNVKQFVQISFYNG